MTQISRHALSPAGRAAYYRVLGRIGLWSDARVCAANDCESLLADRDSSADIDHADRVEFE